VTFQPFSSLKETGSCSRWITVALKHSEGQKKPIAYRMATPEEAAAEAWNFTTENGGTSIRARGE